MNTDQSKKDIPQFIIDEFAPRPMPYRVYQQINKLNNNKMKNPKEVITVIEGTRYELPVYEVTNEGIVDSIPAHIQFCKGNKEDDTVPRCSGLFTESLIQVSKVFLESVNKGELASRETSMAITKLDEALMWLQKRTDDRKLRGVLQTYKK